MAATFTWAVSQCDRILADGGINNVHWQCTATETASGTEYSGYSYGTCGLSYDASSSDFIAYDKLTSAVVLGWLKAKLGADEVARIEKYIDDEITLINTPVTISGKPWEDSSS